MGGKGGSGPPSTMPMQPDTHALDSSLAMMGTLMSGLMGSMQTSTATMMQQAQQQQQQMLMAMQNMQQQAVPPIEQSAPVDWEEKQKQLASRMKADYNIMEKDRKTSFDTVLSSPLLDDEDALVSGSILEGK